VSRDDLVCVGAVAGAFGVRGEVRLKPFTDDPETLFALGPLLDEKGAPALTIIRSRAIKDGYAAFAKEIASREAAEALKSTRLYVPRDRLPATEEDEFYHADLIGLRVVSLAGESLGEVRSVQNYGASDLLEIWKTPGVRQPWLIAFTKEAVPHVDLAKGEVVIDPPEGAWPGEGGEKRDDGEDHGG
jgi:16S rRNA processing protein RimM